jgi:hypothetical protein
MSMRIDCFKPAPFSMFVQPAITIDLALDMDASMFRDRDLKDFGYDDKRSLFLTGVAQTCLDSGFFASVKAEALRNDVNRPVIVLEPHPTSDKHGDKHGERGAGEPKKKRARSSAAIPAGLRIRLIPSLPEDVFSLGVLRPSWPNVRPSTLLGKESSSEGAPGVPSTYYNSCIMEDVSSRLLQEVFALTLSSCPHAVRAIVALKALLRRQGFHRLDDAVHGCVLTAIVVYLLHNHVLVTGMTELQVLRTVLQFLGSVDVSKTPLLLKTVANEATAAAEEASDGEVEEGEETVTGSLKPWPVNKESFKEFTQHHSVVILLPFPVPGITNDGKSGYAPCVNLSHYLSLEAFTELKGVAGRIVSVLNGTRPKTTDATLPAPTLTPSVAFEKLYSEKTSLASRFDRLIALPMPACPKKGSGKTSAAGAQSVLKPEVVANAICCNSSWARTLRREVTQTLRQGLNTRIVSMRVLLSFGDTQVDKLTWELDDAPPQCTGFIVGVSLNHEDGAAGRMVDRGPPPENVAETKAFMDLWGPFAELRRFADGSVVNAVLWNAERLGGRTSAKDAIIPAIVCFLCKRHFSMEMPSLLLHAGDRIVVEGAVTDALPAATAVDNSKLFGAALNAVALADISTVVPSLSLERLLDVGGHSVITNHITFTTAASDASVTPHDVPVRDLKQGMSVRAALDAGESDVLASAPIASADALLAKADPLSKGSGFAAQTLSNAFDYVVKALKAVKGVPLAITSVSSIAPQLRYTAMYTPAPSPLAAHPAVTLAKDSEDVRPPLDETALLQIAGLSASTVTRAEEAAMSVSQVLQPMEAVLEFEGTGKWPDDPLAIAAMKTAFLLKLKYGLTSSYRDSVRAQVYPSHLDVFSSGFCFRFYIFVPRELSQLEKVARRSTSLVDRSTDFGNAGIVATSAATKGFVAVAPAGLHEPEAQKYRRKNKASKGPQTGFSKLGAADLYALSGLRADVGIPTNSLAVMAGERAGVSASAGLIEGCAANSSHVGVEKRCSNDVYAAILSSEGPTSAFSVAIANGTYALSPSQAVQLLEALRLQLVHRPRHAALIHGLVPKLPAYAPTVRLVSAWLSSYGLGPEMEGNGSLSVASDGQVHPSGGSEAQRACAVVAAAALTPVHAASVYDGSGPHFSIELIELTVAYLFLNAFPHEAPRTPSVGLLRWLQLMYQWDWEHEPLLVDLDGSIAEGDARALKIRFKTIRTPSTSADKGAAGSKRPRAEAAAEEPKPAHGPAMYVVTPAERGGWKPIWVTASQPRFDTLQQVIRHARAAASVLETVFYPGISATPASPSSTAPAAVGIDSSFLSSTTSTSLRWAEVPAEARNMDGIDFPDYPVRPVWTQAFGPGAMDAYSHAISAVKNTDISPLYSAVTPRTATITLRPQMLPRNLLDGRCFGAVKAPLACASEAAAAPLVAALNAFHPKIRHASTHNPNKPAAGAAKNTFVVQAAAGGVADDSKFQLSVFKNLLETSKTNLLVGFDPAACYLHGLRDKFGDVATFALEYGVTGASTGAHAVRVSRVAVRGEERGGEGSTLSRSRVVATEVAEMVCCGAGLARGAFIGDESTV